MESFLEAFWVAFNSKDAHDNDECYIVNNADSITKLIDDIINNKNNKEKQYSMCKLLLRHKILIRNPSDFFSISNLHIGRTNAHDHSENKRFILQSMLLGKILR